MFTFENNMIFVPRLNGEVHKSRLIASWYRVGGTITDVCSLSTPFAKFLRSLGINEDDIHDTIQYAMNGKLEVQTLAREFLKNEKEPSD